MLRSLVSSSRTVFKDFILIVLSCLLLRLSFPPWDFFFLSWFCFVPFLLVLDRKKPWGAFGAGYLMGILFFSTTLYWFIHVTLPGVILIILYLSLYFALFALAYALLIPYTPQKIVGAKKQINPQRSFWFELILIPSLWVGLEYIRGHLFTGFGWVCLGHSQYKNLWISQVADITGVGGVSFFIMLVNRVITQWVVVCMIPKSKARPSLRHESLAIGILICLVLGYGLFRQQQTDHEPEISVAVVQANIPQEEKWVRSNWPRIMQKYFDLTTRVSALQPRPELILWPETAFPGFIWEAPDLFVDLKDLVIDIKTPLLLGAVTQRQEQYYNSALMISTQGQVSEQYDKLHLVPFGEYVPLRNVFPFLADIIPIGDFTPGDQYTIFFLPKSREIRYSFSTMICFEDTLPWIARGFVQRGAQFLINITNDAWFLDTVAPWLHLQASVFRAIENHRTLIRAANTGVSCFIDPLGRIYKTLTNDRDKATFIEGIAAAKILLSSQKTIYTKIGDLFTHLCFGCILCGVLCKKRD